MATGAIKRRTRKLSLAFMGEGWDECYVEIYRATVGEGLQVDEIQKQKPGMDGLLETLKLLFASGKAIGQNGDPVELSQDDLDDFDAGALLEMSMQLNEGEHPDPKASTNSEPTTPVTETAPSDSTLPSTKSDTDTPPQNSSPNP